LHARTRPSRSIGGWPSSSNWHNGKLRPWCSAKSGPPYTLQGRWSASPSVVASTRNCYYCQAVSRPQPTLTPLLYTVVLQYRRRLSRRLPSPPPLSYSPALNAPSSSLHHDDSHVRHHCCSRDAAYTLLGPLPPPSPRTLYHPQPLPRLALWSAGCEHRIHYCTTQPLTRPCNTASTAQARSQAPTETSLTSSLPLTRRSRASPWTQTTPCRRLGMLHLTSASTLATRTCSNSRTTHRHGRSPHGKPLHARLPRQPPLLLLLACTPRNRKVCKSLQNISCHPREHVRDDSEMTTALVRRAASTQDEHRGRQKVLAAGTAEYTTGHLCRHSTTREHLQERGVTTM
jgi:hypothetical protein